MKASYIVIYRIHGLNNIPDGNDSTIFHTLKNPMVSVILTENIEPYFVHIDKSAAVASLLLKGRFSPENEDEFQNVLIHEIEEVRKSRENYTKNGVFLVLEGKSETPDPNLEFCRNTEYFSAGFDIIDKSKIKDIFQPLLERIFTAISLSLPLDINRHVQKCGEVIFLCDSNEKPIYTFSIEGRPLRFALATQLTTEVIEEATKLLPRLLKQNNLVRTTRLLTASLEQTDDLQAFIAAWSALEIFVNVTFKSVYKARWFTIMEAGSPDTAKLIFKRFREVMEPRYRLNDRFLVIASVLYPDNANEDAKEFDSLKNLRDKLLHSLNIPDGPLPIGAVQRLLLKYMKRHLLGER